IGIVSGKGVRCLRLLVQVLKCFGTYNALEFIISSGNKSLIGEAILVNTTPSTAAIILAAGSSSRMGGGRHKLLLPLDDRPVLAHVIDASLASQARPIIVVLGHQSDHVRSQIKSYTIHDKITLIENVHYQQGMSSSL